MSRPLLVFISQPMRDRPDAEIKEERTDILKFASELFGEVEEVPSYFEGAKGKQMKPLYMLGQSLQLLSASEVAFFAPGWEEARGCRIEHECAVQYGIKIVDLSNGQYEQEAS